MTTRPSHATESPHRVLTTATIEKLVAGGEGLARLTLPGQSRSVVAWVPDTIAGEVVTLPPLPDPFPKRGWRVAYSALSVASPQRAEPQCPHAGMNAQPRCGGCSWQHIRLAEQHRSKAAIVAETLSRVGGCSQVVVRPVKETPPWHSRTTVTWHVLPNHQLGFLQAGSHHGVAIERCDVVHAALQECLQVFQAGPSWVTALLTGMARVKARVVDGEALQLGFESKEDAPPFCWEESVLAALRHALPQVQSLWLLSSESGWRLPRCVWGETSGSLTLPMQTHTPTFQVSLPHFLQAQPQGAALLAEAVAEAVAWVLQQPRQAHQPFTLWEGYAGMGLLGLSVLSGPLGSHIHQATLVESDEAATALAQHNAQQLGVANRCTVHTQTVEAYCASTTPLQPWTVAVVDPPRAGCASEVVDWLAHHVEQALVYVSCDVATLARDCARLNEQGWQVQWVQPVDCFPQTAHIETVTVLTRKTSTD
ncbi:MAG: hypothetical protein U0003_04865 [Vampirovibrionales bacterium]